MVKNFIIAMFLKTKDRVRDMFKDESGQAALEYLLIIAALFGIIAFVAYMVNKTVWNPAAPNSTVAYGIIERIEYYRKTVIGRG
mgnify:CR=1 FL=1